MPLGISSTIITISGHNETKICQSVFTTFLGGFTRRINRHLSSCQLISLYKGIPVEMVSTRNHQLTSRRPEENWQLSTLSHSTFYGHQHSLRSLKQVSLRQMAVPSADTTPSVGTRKVYGPWADSASSLVYPVSQNLQSVALMFSLIDVVNIIYH